MVGYVSAHLAGPTDACGDYIVDSISTARSFFLPLSPPDCRECGRIGSPFERGRVPLFLLPLERDHENTCREEVHLRASHLWRQVGSRLPRPDSVRRRLARPNRWARRQSRAKPLRRRFPKDSPRQRFAVCRPLGKRAETLKRLKAKWKHTSNFKSQIPRITGHVSSLMHSSRWFTPTTSRMGRQSALRKYTLPSEGTL